MKFLTLYIVISVFLSCLNLLIALAAMKKGTRVGYFLSLAAFCASVANISYLFSILSFNYRFVSITSSLYFAAIDLMLNALIHFTAEYTRLNKSIRVPLLISHLYAAFDIACFAINPFKEIILNYVYRDTAVAPYAYRMMPLYKLHLFYTYLLVAASLMILLYKACRVTAGYRSQYILGAAGIILIVLLNAIFLYLPNLGILSLLDVSTNLYPLVSMYLYWCSMIYSQQSTLTVFKNAVFENVDQGILFFDYNQELSLFNRKAESFLSDTIALSDGLKLRYFLNGCGIGDLNIADLGITGQAGDNARSADSYSVQCYVRREGDVLPLRLDYRLVKNNRGRLIGQMFVLSDLALETDLITGFHKWENFCRFAAENSKSFPIPTVVTACDINGLSTINSTQGRENGDRVIKELADLLRRHFRKEAYYIRGEEATLLVIDYTEDKAQVLRTMAMIRDAFDHSIQYAVAVTSEERPLILDAVEEACQTMRTRKVLDHSSAHSSVLASLEKALQECDPDTEEHVTRTRENGARFARRLGLSGRETSQLELLCVMHDIGKIGVPLDILTKPDKLTDDEWHTMQQHTDKGYQIALSSPELKPIADMVLHHHEKWDGTGYPDGLSKESIPLLSRVIAILDAYDAMISRRPYKEPLSPSEARAELIRSAGTQFDPRLVSEFVHMLNEEDGIPPAPVDKPATIPPAVEAAPEESAVHSVPYAHYYLDEDMVIFHIDHRFTELTGYTESDLKKTPMRQIDLIPEEDRTEYLCLVQESLGRTRQAYLEHHIRRKDGSVIEVLCFGRHYYDTATRSMRSEIMVCRSSAIKAVRDLADAEKARAKAQLRYWEDTYRRDSLTGLLSHGAFIDDVEIHLLQKSTRVVLLMFDVDKFKEYNDTYGHRAGDEFLIFIAQTLSGAMRRHDLTCRMGGDEFAAALFFGTDESLHLIHERIQQIFQQLLTTIRAAYPEAGISMGAAISGDEHETFAMIYDKADKALYHSKENGRSRYTIAD
ncbi:MAG: diguanylate cyclase [Lachnospiraceae bacterium]|nr:diguanylate cyclase [Lachnospiraceae bacterium]